MAPADGTNARLRTLLPIVRGTVAVVLIVMTVLMALSALGVQVGPLLASAGVIGIAIGFGAQTLVRDMFSKFFYLLDDAFRVGEYIQSGNYKGTVEHLGVRSVVLRHHRGPVYTIPYGQLGAVQNQSRDWVIDKLHHRPHLRLRPRQGEEADQEDRQGPGAGSRVRAGHPRAAEDAGRRGVRRLRDPDPHEDDDQAGPAVHHPAPRLCADQAAAFDANGIKFAKPTVQVAGEGDAAAVAAVRKASRRQGPAEA